LLYRSAAFRDLAGRLSGRGHLVAIANQRGIYETDLGNELSAQELIGAENLRRAAADEALAPAVIERELALFEAQFGDDKSFRKALRTDGISLSSLREKVTSQLRGLAWLEKQVRSASTVTEQECRQLHDARTELFTQPVRFRASHLFLAAHAETPPEDVEQKEVAIVALAARLGRGEDFSQLVAEASEDEATKSRGGDLGYFSETRMPSEVIAELKKLRVGEISKPFRSHLGFHIAQVTEIKPLRDLSLEESRQEISVAIANERRAGKVEHLARSLSRPDH